MRKYMEFAGPTGAGEGVEALCVLLDLSFSMGAGDYKPTRLGGAKVAATSLLQVKRDHHPGDLVAIAGFSCSGHRLHSLAPVDSDFKSLEHALERARLRGSTNITSGLALAGQMLSKKVPLTPNTLGSWFTSLVLRPSPEVTSSRILVLSDGADTTNSDPADIARTLKDQGVVIDVIGIGDPGRQHLDEDQLKRIASRNPDGSPRYFFIDDTEELIRTFQKLAHHIKVMDFTERE